MNVTGDPAQVGLVPVVTAIATEGISAVATVIVIPALVSLSGLAHAKFDVRIHVITFPFVKVVVV